MNVYITKLNGLPLQDTSQYIQRMTAEIAHQLGCREMGIYRYNGANESSDSLNGRLDGIIAGIEWGEDVVICQFPTGNGLKYERELINRLKMYQARVVIFIHDSAHLVKEANRASLEETVRLYNRADVLIVPSLAMRQFLLENGLKKNMKFVIQEMWDCTTDLNFFSSPQFRKEIHFADSNGFEGMDKWHSTLPLKTYTSLVNTGQNVHNIGELSPGELLSALSKGGFGLVWYQDEDSRRCMEYGISFSLARYLAAGIPVIVPVGISAQMLIEKNHLGLLVHSLSEAISVIETMTELEYQKYIQYIRQFAPTIKNGYYTKKCLVDVVQAVCRKDTDKIITPVCVYDLGDRTFTYTTLKESYGGNLTLSWIFHGKPSGFLIYDVSGKLIYDTQNVYQHSFQIKGYVRESGFVIKAYIDTLKGKGIIAESSQIYLQEQQHEDIDVSLIIPAYNVQDCLVRSIDTALSQSYSGLEIIIVDDGSTDHTADVADWYAKKYSNIIVIHQKNGGVGSARNTGIEHARGEYIGFMDSDDKIHPDMIKRLYHSAKKNDCDIAVTSVYQIENSGYKKLIQYPLEDGIVLTGKEFFEMHFKEKLIFYPAVWNKLYRASLVKEHLFPEYFLGEDGAWTPYILSYANRISYVNGFLYEYDRVIRNSTLEGQWRNKTKEERFIMHKNIVMFYLKNGNHKNMSCLCVLAKLNLLEWGTVYVYDKYEKLWCLIAENLDSGCCEGKEI